MTKRYDRLVTATMHRIGAGDGYRYYTAMTASADERRAPGEDLGDYYTRTGNPAGLWAGKGLSALGVSGEVTETQLGQLLGLGRHPVTGEQLGSRYRIYATVEERIDARTARLGKDASTEQVAAVRAEEERKGERQAVAGFDVTFSPVKSVSVAWGLATPAVAAELAAAHDAAVASSLAWIEREVITARIGEDGVSHVDIDGLVAAQFVHRTSRVGDPDLHTHVVISNKVQAVLPDGSRKWLTLDSRSLYKANVAFSERYNRLLEDEIGQRLGWTFAARSDQAPGAVSPIRELTSVPEPLIAAFSRRRQQIEADYSSRLRQYRERHGKEAPKAVQYQLAQAACLAQRPAKVASSEVSERAAWQGVAADILTEAEAVQLRTDLALRRTLDTVQELTPEAVQAAAQQAVASLEERQSDWTVRHLAAQITRQTADVRFSSDTARDRVIGQVITAAQRLDGSLMVSAPEAVETPQTYRRADGRPVWEAPGSLRYSTTGLLDAEERLVTAAKEHVSPEVDTGAMRAVLDTAGLSADQDAAVQLVATGGRRVQMLIGPAGTGKTTTMRTLVAVWQQAAGRPVRGLAPTAAAASVLRTETGMDSTATIDLWATRRAHGHESARFEPGELVIVDEAGMAGTLNLDRVVAAARADGASVLLVGDPYQLAAVASGGAMRLIQHDVGAAALHTVWRFSDRDPTSGERVIRQWEADASLAIRGGDEAGLEPYFEHDRITSGSREAMTDQVYAAWRTDQDAGTESVMLAADNTTVQELSERARRDRVTAGQVSTRGGARLHNGSTASRGDKIVTRLNDRTLRVGPDFVKNGDLWTVTGTSSDGTLMVTGRHGKATLPADYVQRHVELGYAMTVHRAQGLTVDTVHAIADDSMSRELLYVAATRGRTHNRLYAVSEYVLDAEAERPTDPNQPARAVLAGALRRSDAAISATEAIRVEQQRAMSIGTQVQRYRYVQSVQQPAEQILTAAAPGAIAAAVFEDEQGWPQLARHLEWSGAGAVEQLRAAFAAPLTASPAGGGARSKNAASRSGLPRPVTHPAEILLQRLAAAEERRNGDWLPRPGTDAGDYRVRLIEHVQQRAEHLGLLAAEERPSWTERLGDLPDEPSARAQWQQRAGRIAAYREAFEVHSRDQPLGPQPREIAQRILWAQAATALPEELAAQRGQEEAPQVVAEKQPQKKQESADPIPVREVEREIGNRSRSDQSPDAGRYAAIGTEQLHELRSAVQQKYLAARHAQDRLTTESAERPGPRERACDDKADKARERLGALDEADSAAIEYQRALDYAHSRIEERSQHQQTTPKRRDRAAWEQRMAELREAEQTSEAAAISAGGRRVDLEVAVGKTDRRVQLREEAEGILASADSTRQQAIDTDAAERAELTSQASQVEQYRDQLHDITAELDTRRPVAAVEIPDMHQDDWTREIADRGRDFDR